MSLRHLVLLKFNPGTPADAGEALAEGLRELPGLIPEIVDYRVGPDLGLSDGSWDFGISADFATAADWATYRDHPEHQQRIRDLVLPITAERASVQIQT